MIIYLTKIEAHGTKHIAETKYKDMILWDAKTSPEAAIEEARNQVKLINYFRLKK